MVKGSTSQASVSGAGLAPATTVGGARSNQLTRRNVGGTVVQAPVSGRKAAGSGILRFYTDDAPGLKVGPTTVLVLSLVFIASVVILHILGKLRGSSSPTQA